MVQESKLWYGLATLCWSLLLTNNGNLVAHLILCDMDETGDIPNDYKLKKLYYSEKSRCRQMRELEYY